MKKFISIVMTFFILSVLTLLAISRESTGVPTAEPRVDIQINTDTNKCCITKSSD